MQAAIDGPSTELPPVNVSSWPASPPKWPLLENEVHVWCARLDAPAPAISRFESALSDDERARARRFLRVQDQRRFVVGRGVLRHLLATYLECEPATIDFVYGQSGKPALANSDAPFQFNLAHSDEFAVYAITSNIEVGIDIELIRELNDLDGIANRFFAPDEVKRLNLLPRKDVAEAFFNCWTRKEAFLKGKGQGIGNGLDQFEVSLAPGEPARLIRSRLNPGDVREWTLFDLRPVPGYAAALAVRSPHIEVRCWRW